MATIAIKVVYTDGTEVVSNAGPRAQIAAERHFKKSITDLSGDEKKGIKPTLEFMYFLAWAGLHFAAPNQLEDRDFDQFLSAVADVEDAEDVEGADPTGKAQ